jgi:hypothetical protein
MKENGVRNSCNISQPITLLSACGELGAFAADTLRLLTVSSVAVAS